MTKRLFTGAVIALCIVGAFLLREVNLYIFDIFIGVLALFSTLEISKILLKAGKSLFVLPTLLYTALAYLFILLGINYNFGFTKIIVGLVLMLAVVFIGIFVFMFIAKESTKVMMKLSNYKGNKKNFILKTAVNNVFSCVYPSLCLLMLIPVSHFTSFSADFSKLEAFGSADFGLIPLLFAIVTSMLSDVFAYFVGSIFGGKKLCPTISPNKTISGAVGGVIGSILGGVVLFVILCTNNGIANGFDAINLTMVWAIIISLFASIITQLGDLLESALKRKAKVKDSGNILPGHGGLMDRFDGFTLNAVFMVVVFALLML